MKWLRRDSFSLETLTAIQSILWGFWVLLPMDTFHSSPVYSVMATVAPEEAWGILFLIVGLLQLVTLIARGDHLIARGRMATTMLMIWTFAEVGFLASGSSSAATITYLSFVIASAWSVISLALRTRT